MKVRNKQIVEEDSIELLGMKTIGKAELSSTRFENE